MLEEFKIFKLSHTITVNVYVGLIPLHHVLISKLQCHNLLKHLSIILT